MEEMGSVEGNTDACVLGVARIHAGVSKNCMDFQVNNF